MTPSRIVIAGASGVIGRHLIAASSDRYQVAVLTRSAAEPFPRGITPITWRPDAARAGDQEALSRLTSALDGATALVNLAGASMADGRLGRAHLKRVLESRIDSTTTLVTATQRCRRPPQVMVQGSAVGIYGQRGEALLAEDAGPGDGSVLRGVVEAWEAAATPASARLRLCVLRIGVVLATDAPAWQQLLLPIRLGAGGRLGPGTQWYSWIDADDLARAVLHLIETDACAGVYNAVAPEPVRQQELARATAGRLRRPLWLPVPSWLLRVALGRLADAVLLQSVRAVPTRLLASGFEFRRGTVETVLEALLPQRQRRRPQR